MSDETHYDMDDLDHELRCAIAALGLIYQRPFRLFTAGGHRWTWIPAGG